MQDPAGSLPFPFMGNDRSLELILFIYDLVYAIKKKFIRRRVPAYPSCRNTRNNRNNIVYESSTCPSLSRRKEKVTRVLLNLCIADSIASYIIVPDARVCQT